MVATLRRGYVVVALALVLLAGMFGWTMKVSSAAPLHSSVATHHQLSLECPPPPYNCQGGILQR